MLYIHNKRQKNGKPLLVIFVLKKAYIKLPDNKRA